ncbi:hypothetical protein [Kribbella deserti]|uniref:Uncharacterized protein n=1 Tax=Kribbella deserti TaxID=1926257 RepID=A0ABV6QX61_9ACTN
MAEALTVWRRTAGIVVADGGYWARMEPADLQPDLEVDSPQPPPELPADHQRPDGLDDTTVAALGTLTDALETVIRARGHLYAFHQLTGRADHRLDDAVELLREAGHSELADQIETDLIGRNVIPGRWTFQIIEGYDDNYYDRLVEMERKAREQLADGKRHLNEAEMKQRRTTPGRPGHEMEP